MQFFHRNNLNFCQYKKQLTNTSLKKQVCSMFLLQILIFIKNFLINQKDYRLHSHLFILNAKKL